MATLPADPAAESLLPQPTPSTTLSTWTTWGERTWSIVQFATVAVAGYFFIEGTSKEKTITGIAGLSILAASGLKGLAQSCWHRQALPPPDSSLINASPHGSTNLPFIQPANQLPSTLVDFLENKFNPNLRILCQRLQIELVPLSSGNDTAATITDLDHLAHALHPKMLELTLLDTATQDALAEKSQELQRVQRERDAAQASLHAKTQELEQAQSAHAQAIKDLEGQRDAARASLQATTAELQQIQDVHAQTLADLKGQLATAQASFLQQVQDAHAQAIKSIEAQRDAAQASLQAKTAILEQAQSAHAQALAELKGQLSTAQANLAAKTEEYNIAVGKVRRHEENARVHEANLQKIQAIKEERDQLKQRVAQLEGFEQKYQGIQERLKSYAKKLEEVFEHFTSTDPGVRKKIISKVTVEEPDELFGGLKKPLHALIQYVNPQDSSTNSPDRASRLQRLDQLSPSAQQ